MSFQLKHLLCGLLAAGATIAMRTDAAAGDICLQSDLPLTTYRANVHSGRGEMRFDWDADGSDPRYKIENFWGEAIAEGRLEAGGKRLSIPQGLPAGYYRIKIIAGGGIAAQSEFSVTGGEEFPTADENAVFGIQTHLSQQWSQDCITLARAIGMNFVRDTVAWAHVERQQDVLDFTLPPCPAFRDSTERIHILQGFCYGSQFHDNGSAPSSAEGLKAWSAYANETMRAFPKLKYTEVWNEFNAGFLTNSTPTTPENYLKILRSTYDAVKSARPDGVVVGGAAVTIPYEWIGRLLDIGGGQCMDALSVHPYRWGDWQKPPETLYPDLKRFCAFVHEHHGCEKLPVWATEIGWPVDPAYGIFPDRQGIYAVRAVLNLQRAGVAKSFIYSFMKPAYDRQQYGLSTLSSDLHFTPRAGYHALGVLNRQLTGAEFLGELEAPPPVLGMKYRKDGSDLAVIWNPQATPAAIDLPCASGEIIRVVDFTGTEHAVEAVDGRVTLILGEVPVYVHGKFGRIAGSDGIRVEVPQDTAVENSDFTIRLEGKPSLRLALRGQTYAPGDIKVQPPEVREGCNIRGVLSDNGRDCGLVCLSFETGERLAMQGCDMPHLDQLQLHFRDNSSQSGLTFTDAQVKIDGEAIPVPWELPLAMPRERDQTLTLTLPKWECYDLHKIEIALKCDGGQELRHCETIGRNPCHRMDCVDVDGDLSEWQDLPHIDLRKNGVTGYFRQDLELPETFSAKVWVGWNDERFFIAAEVTDPIHNQLFPIETGDSLQFGISRSRPMDKDTTVEGALAMRLGGPSWFFPMWTPLGFNSSEWQKYASVSHRRSGNVTRYECSTPWRHVQFVDPGQGSFRFSVMLNENDGMRAANLSWGGGLFPGTNPLEYIICTFAQ